MAMIAERKPAPMEFLLKRAARIWPLYVVCTTFALVFFLALQKNMGFSSLSDAYFKSLFFIPITTASWKITPLLFPAWTLYFELFFYLLLGSFLAISRARAVNLAMFALPCLVLLSRSFDFTSSMLFLEFLLGMIVWKLRPASGLVSRRTFAIVMAGSFLTLCLLEYVGNSHRSALFISESHYRVVAYAPVGGLIIWASLGVNIQPATSSITRWLVRAGDESYALYLTHAFVVYGFLYISPIESRTVLSQMYVLAAGIPLALLLASQVHRYVDAPIQSALKKRLS